MHISADPPVCRDVLFFGVMDPHIVSLSPSCRDPIHLQQTAANNYYYYSQNSRPFKLLISIILQFFNV